MAGQPSVPGIPEGSVIITPAEVYNEVRDLTKAVNALLERDSRTDERFTDIEARLRDLERRVWVAAGFAAAIGSAIATWITRTVS